MPWINILFMQIARLVVIFIYKGYLAGIWFKEKIQAQYASVFSVKKKGIIIYGKKYKSKDCIYN